MNNVAFYNGVKMTVEEASRRHEIYAKIKLGVELTEKERAFYLFSAFLKQLSIVSKSVSNALAILPTVKTFCGVFLPLTQLQTVHLVTPIFLERRAAVMSFDFSNSLKLISVSPFLKIPLPLGRLP